EDPGAITQHAPPPPVSDEAMLSAGPTGANLTLEELATASGLPLDQLRELERSGFITGRPVAGTTLYDEEALVVANLAAGFARFGIEARHLRLYKNAAEREAGLFEQVVTPLLKQRNPQARGQATEALGDLSHLGQRLRAAMLRQAVKAITGG
ncbi:MAG: MerR family transcriptional regulator, partial [Actinomycetota bacterium]|nr:MerR family transcriptional regulator [Actinomycetota bacterium]